jgi:hypothetical protein
MRQPGGLTEIEAAIDKLSRHHIRHIKAYDPNEGMPPYSVISKFLEFLLSFAQTVHKPKLKFIYRVDHKVGRLGANKKLF